MSPFANPYFLQIGVPLVAVAGSIFLKPFARNDAHKAFRKEDLAFGLDLALTALLLFATTGSKIAQAVGKNPADSIGVQKLLSLVWLVCCLGASICVLSYVIRKKGWSGDGTLNIFWGIVFPDVFGVVALLFAVNTVN